MKVTTAEPLQTVASNNPIIIVESSGGGGGGSSKRALTNTPSHSKLNKTNILPPSPPSSFGSDSESNHSSASSHSTGHKLGVSSSKLLGITKAGKHSSLASKTCKLSSSLRNSSTLMKQMRHQPYTGYKATLGSGKSKSVAVKCEETVLNTSGANCLNMSTNSDDDCWPFLCSLSVILNNYLILFEVKFLFCYCFWLVRSCLRPVRSCWLKKKSAHLSRRVTRCPRSCRSARAKRKCSKRYDAKLKIRWVTAKSWILIFRLTDGPNFIKLFHLRGGGMENFSYLIQTIK